MKILHLTWSRMQSYGGIQSHLTYLNRELERLGIDAITHMLPSTTSYHAMVPGDQQRLPYEGFRDAIEEIVQAEDVDIIHSNNLHLPHAEGIADAVAQCANDRKIGHVVTIHDVASQVGGVRDVLRSLRAASLVTTSRFNAEQLHRLGISSRVIPPGIDFKRFRTTTEAEPRTVAYPGRLTPPKGALNTIRILGQLADSVGPVTLLLSDRTRKTAGETEDFLDDLDAEIAEWPNLTAEFVGGDQAIPRIYQRATLTMCLPNVEEGFGLVPLESLASLRPVVATPTGGMLEWLPGQPGAIVLGTRDPGPISLAVRRILGDWQEWRAACEKAREHLRTRFDVQHTAQQYLKLYQSLLTKRHSWVSIVRQKLIHR